MRLSILIPAYDYAEGIERILSSFKDVPASDFELIIFDDSDEEQVSRVVIDFSREFQGDIKYRRNRPSLGAVVNWNALLEHASGEYILLLHHDEYPMGANFSCQVLELLTNNPNADVFVFDCILMSNQNSMARPHLPMVLKKLAIKYFPTYLFKRNLIGPMSCLVVRRNFFPRFDEQLRWLVDVEAYFRLRLATRQWHFCRKIRIGSMQGRDDSITTKIMDELKQLDSRERIYLSSKYPIAEIWLLPKMHSILNALELAAWMSMRVVTCLWYRLNNCFA